ncbi:MAG: DUF1080 domain-containing protein [Bacteroidetes bacterium]|nr:MAG: DUF1080 domain-containing protein [Bacteroidota bacterium]
MNMKFLLTLGKNLAVAALYLGLTLGCSQNQQQDQQQEEEKPVENQWVDLFNGINLDGWEIRLDGGESEDGSIPFMVEDGMIVSTAELGSPNGYLSTIKEYDNFVLEWEVKIDTTLNSGVQIRGQVWERDTTTTHLSGNGETQERNWEAGTVWGYQIEVDPSTRRWSGGLYEPRNRGWIVDLVDNKEAGEAFDRTGWNKMKVEVNGTQIKTWVNDVLAVDTNDDVLKSGFIGLQYHKVYHKAQDHKKVYWRNIRIKEL